MTLDRRDLLRISALLGISLVASGSGVSHAAPPAGADIVLGALAETIIPTTDTPGAVEAGVVPFILLMLSEWFEDADRERYWRGYEAFEAKARASFGRSFAALPQKDRDTFVETALASATSPPDFIALTKRLTVFGYYTSEIGAARELMLNIAASYDPHATMDHAGHAPALGRRFHNFSLR